MNTLLISSGFYLIYLVIDARQDASYILRYGRIYHGWNWALKASTIMGIGYANFENWIQTAAYCFLMVPITWIVFELFLYGFMDKNPLTYVGSGGWDEWFKYHFGNRGKNDARASRAIWISKLLLLIFALWIFLYTKNIDWRLS